VLVLSRRGSVGDVRREEALGFWTTLFMCVFPLFFRCQFEMAWRWARPPLTQIRISSSRRWLMFFFYLVLLSYYGKTPLVDPDGRKRTCYCRRDLGGLWSLWLFKTSGFRTTRIPSPLVTRIWENSALKHKKLLQQPLFIWYFLTPYFLNSSRSLSIQIC